MRRIAAFLLMLGAAWAASSEPPGTRPALPLKEAPAEPFLYIPPELTGRVRFYHSFEQGPDKPEVNLLGAKVFLGGADAKGWCDSGLTGRAFQISQPGKAARGPELRDLSIGLNRPLTVSMWWRLDAPMKADSSFALIALNTPSGYISNFVRGQGQWCQLREPTFVVQVYQFAGISNVNGIDFGDAWVDAGRWHHVAITVSAGSQVSVYWDGCRRSTFPVKGRLFHAKDVVGTIALGSGWLAHPMTIDEVMILDCALAPREIADYFTAAGKLAEVRFPFRRD